MDKNKNTAELSCVMCDNTVTHEVGEEFNLPDYTPEIRKMISVRAKVLPEKSEISAGEDRRAVISGVVTYSLLYTDDDGQICSASLSSDYETSVPLPEGCDEVYVSTIAENVNCKILSKRRLSLKTKLRSRIFGTGEKEISDEIKDASPADELGIERLVSDVSNMRISKGSLGDLKISEQFDLPKNGKTLRPVWCDGQLLVRETKISGGSLNVSGDITVKCLCIDGASDAEAVISMPEMLTKTVPFNEDIEIDGLSEGDGARAVGRCVSLSVGNEQGSDGGEHLYFDLIFELDGESARNVQTALTSDLYSVNDDIVCSYRTEDIYSHVKTSAGSFSVNESLPAKENAGGTVIDTEASVTLDRYEIKNGRLVMSGNCAVYALCAGKGENGAEFYGEEYTVPVKYECDAGNIAGEYTVRCDCTPARVSGRTDGDKFNVNAEISVSYTVLGKSGVQSVDGAKLEKTDGAKKESGICVYYPIPGETLWEIAKRYRVPQRKVSEQNGIDASPTSAVSVRKILI